MPDPTIQQLQTAAAAQDRSEESAPLAYREIGSSGLKRLGGVITEEYLPELQGPRGIRIFTEMSTNDPIASAMSFSLAQLLKRLPWDIVAPENATPEESAATDFVQSCWEDMDVPWSNVIEDILSEVVYGWSFLETCYKLRMGPDATQDWQRSVFSDGKIGWKSFRIRAQDTLVQWIYDQKGNLLAMEQLDPNGGGLRTIPLAKALLFRTTTVKDNPEGRSLLRGAYRPWYFKKRIEEYEAIGVERDLAGLPVVRMAPDYFSPTAPPELQRTRQIMEDLVAQVRNDTTSGLVIPVAYDEKGNKLIDFELAASPGQKAFDTNAIINRKNQEMAMSILMDFLMLGHEGIGSFALGTAKIDLWTTSIDAVASGIAQTFQQYAIKPLLRANRIPVTRAPVLSYGDVANEDLGTLADFLERMVNAGLLTPSPEMETYVREAANLPPVEEQPYGVATPTQ